ncbi:MAG: DUF177 domain-containing protein [Rubrivivax sp.]
MPAAFDARRLDLVRFAADAARLEGAWPVAAFERLAADAPPQAEVPWSVRGESRPVAGGAPETWLHLDARATVTLQCQRCLQAMAQPLAVARSFRFVADEAEAERLDEESDDDVLALPPRGRLDLLPLVEDELILALPLVPRHEVCPEPLPLPADDRADERVEHPFAKLAALTKAPN